jgi:hypothetical protein
VRRGGEVRRATRYIRCRRREKRLNRREEGDTHHETSLAEEEKERRDVEVR